MSNNLNRSVLSSVACLLCKEEVNLDDGDKGKYEGHLRDVHGVWSNRLWLVEQTFFKQKDEESLTMTTAVKNVLTKIKVKRIVESEIEDISDLQVLPVKLEDSVCCEPLRRSSRKRSASRSPGEKTMKDKKPRDLVTINIKEPEDLLLLGVALGSSTNDQVNTSDRRVLTKQDSHLVDLNMNCQVNTGPDSSTQNDSDSFQFGENCQSKCEECKEIFKVSLMEFHVKNIHGVSLKDYLEVHGDPQTGMMKLCSTLKTYDGELKKNKDVNGNESKSSNEANTEDVTPECLIVSDEEVQENRSDRRLKVPGPDDETIVTECVASTDDEELVVTHEPQSEFHFPKLSNSPEKFYSDSYEDSCIVECSICDKHMPIERLRGHTSSQHHMPIAKYKEQFGSQPTFVKTAFHLCKLCGKEVQLDKDSMAAHVRGAHKWTAKQYNSQHMVMRKRKVGHVDEELREIAQEAEEGETSLLNEQQWFDANTFTCKVCMFVSTSLDMFKKHTKLTHKMSLSKFSCWYSKTDVWYMCQCCDKEVYHERSSIKAHVEEGHLLSMQQYAGLYERRKILELESERKDKLECCVVLNHSQELEIDNVAENDPGKDPLEITMTEDCDMIEVPSSAQLLASPSVQALSPVLPAQVSDDHPVLHIIAEIVESIIPPFGRTDAQAEVTGEDKQASSGVEGSCSVSNTTCDTSSAPSPALPDIYLYMCPAHHCDFHTDFRGLESGVAAKHAASAHQAAPQQVLEPGLEWKKVSLETRMEQLFAED